MRLLIPLLLLLSLLGCDKAPGTGLSPENHTWRAKSTENPQKITLGAHTGKIAAIIPRYPPLNRPYPPLQMNHFARLNKKVES